MKTLLAIIFVCFPFFALAKEKAARRAFVPQIIVCNKIPLQGTGPSSALVQKKRKIVIPTLREEETGVPLMENLPSPPSPQLYRYECQPQPVFQKGPMVHPKLG